MLKEAIPYLYTYFSLEKLRNVLKECPVAVLPAGSLEWHGEHNALGLDAHSATVVAEKAVIYLGNGAVLPTEYTGTYGWSRMPGCFVFNHGTTEEIFYEYFREMIKIGFKVCVILTGHWGRFQTEALKNAVHRAEEFAAKTGKKVSVLGFRIIDIMPSPDYAHALGLETSVNWAVGEMLGIPLVFPDKFPKEDRTYLGDSLYPPYNPDAPDNDPREFLWPEDFTDPAYCSPERGKEYIDKAARGLALEILENMDELGLEYRPPRPIEPPL